MTRKVFDQHERPEDNLELVTSLCDRARLYCAQKRFDEAEPLYRRALAIDMESYGRNHPNTASDQNNLAGLLRDW